MKAKELRTLTRGELEQRLRDSLGWPLTLTVHFVDELLITEGGKHRRVVGLGGDGTAGLNES